MNIVEDNRPFVSVVIPVKNAERFLPQCLHSLNRLNYPKDKYEIIIADSDSKDKTREIAASLGAKVIIASGESVCAGRNSGFKIAKGEIVAFSDADCLMDKDWLSNAIKYFNDDKVCCVGGPSLIPEDETAFGRACGFIFSYSLFTGGSTYGRSFHEVREVKHNAGCNAIYRRDALEKIMPIDEWFVEGEDVIMNKELRDLGYRFLYTPDTKLWHYRSSTPQRFWKQNFRYAIGRVLMGKYDRRLINPLHIMVGLSLPILFTIIILLWSINFIYSLICLFLCIAFLGFFFFSALVKTKSFNVALNVPFAILILIAAWSLGFMHELFFPVHKKTKHL